MIKPKIGIDWDDVIAPFNSIAVGLANECENANITMDMITWGNINGTECLNKYYKDERLYHRQKVSEENRRCIEQLMKFADVYIITAVSCDFMGYRAKQIKETFPNIEDRQIILGAAKTLVKFDIVLDDGIHNLLDSPSDFKVLMRKPWNREMTGMLAVNNLKEFVVLVEQILNAPTEKNEKIKNPSVIALVGPSGCGKNEIADRLSLMSFVERITNYTTNETRTENHIFVDESKWNDEDYFEHTYYGGFRYGCKYEDIAKCLNKGNYVVIPIDMCGAISMKRVFDTHIFFISRKKERLIKEILKKPIEDDEMTLRLLSLDVEKSNRQICDYIIDNNNDNASTEILRYL